MAHAGYIREKAIELRKERAFTIDELAERMAVSRSTIYYWVKDIPITRKPNTGWPESARRKGNRAMQRKYRLIREAEYERGLEEYTEFLAVPTFRDFVTLFLTEGYKRSRNTVSIANSDPAAVALAQAWLCRLARNPITAYSRWSQVTPTSAQGSRRGWTASGTNGRTQIHSAATGRSSVW